MVSSYEQSAKSRRIKSFMLESADRGGESQRHAAVGSFAQVEDVACVWKRLGRSNLDQAFRVCTLVRAKTPWNRQLKSSSVEEGGLETVRRGEERWCGKKGQ